jgi:integrase
MTLDTKLQALPGTSLRSLVKGYLLSHQMEGSSPHTVAYYKGILSRFIWYGGQEGWPDDTRLLTQWQIREFLGYVGGEVNRWAVKGNGSESSSRRASPRTVHHYYRALTAFFNWVVREGFLAESPMAKVRVAKPKHKVIKPYTLGQIERTGYPLPMRNTLVPQVGHTPCVAGLPFFKVTDFGFLISFFARHFMQYACIRTPFYSSLPMRGL